MLYQRLPWWPVVVLLLGYSSLKAQMQDTATALPVITIQAFSLRQTLPGESVQPFDSARLHTATHQSLADVLSAQTGIYVKSYGLGSLATLSLRGSSSSQVAITWNGIPIQSPMLGLTDIALLPAFAADAVTLHYGSSGAQWGSGAVGGTLALGSRPPRSGTQLTYNGATGSFGTQNHQARINWSNGRWGTATKWFNGRATNDFSYPLTPQIRRQQTNAHAAQQGFLQEIYWSPRAPTQWSAHLWRQTNQRQIPPLTTQTRSLAFQNDSVWRAVVQGRFWLKKHIFLTKMAFFDEKINYQDPQIVLVAPTGFRTWVAELEHKWQCNRFVSVQTGGQWSAYSAFANAYADTVREQRTALFTNVRWQRGRWQMQASARQEWQDGRAVPLMPAFGWAYRPRTWATWKGKLSRHYRLPTLNERYWQPGGNPDILPERGWSAETGLEIRTDRGFYASVNAYHRYIHNWVIWALQEGQFFFSANNITAVQSRGTEQRLGWQHQRRNWTLDLGAGYDYARSVNQIAVQKPALPAGEQLAYTPVHRAFGHVYAHWRGVGVQWQSQFTGAVGGFNEDVPAFWVHQARVEYTVRWRGAQGQFFFQTNNIFNHAYQVIERRPMPGRHYMIGVTTQFFIKNAH